MKHIAIKKKVAELKYDTYTTIVFKTHYDERLEEYYRNNYKFFEKYIPSAKKNPSNGLLEKAEIKWFTFAELRKNKSSFRKFYQHMVDVVLAHEDLITKTLMKMKSSSTRMHNRMNKYKTMSKLRLKRKRSSLGYLKYRNTRKK
jgi:hypothetical protein